MDPASTFERRKGLRILALHNNIGHAKRTSESYRAFTKHQSPNIRMSKKTVRNNEYFEERLRRDHPTIYADLKAGKYSTVTDALLAAGLKTKRTRLHEMKNAWGKASLDEQREFLMWLRADIKAKLPVTPSSSSMPIAHDRKLLPDAIARVKDIMSKRRLRLGSVMDEMGFIRLDASLGMALRQKTRLRPEMIAALEKWLVANSSI